MLPSSDLFTSYEAQLIRQVEDTSSIVTTPNGSKFCDKRKRKSSERHEGVIFVALLEVKGGFDASLAAAVATHPSPRLPLSSST